MPGYRLTFGTMDMRVNDMADALISADGTLGEVSGPLAAHGTILSLDYLAAVSSNQFIVRFEAGDDALAVAMANAAIDAISVPVDGISIARRSRSYVPVPTA